MSTKSVYTMSQDSFQPYSTRTRAIDSRLLESRAASEAGRREQEVFQSNWRRVADDELLEIGRTAGSGLDEDGIFAPSRALMSRAFSYVAALQQDQFPAPFRVFPTARGGIAFEWKFDPFVLVVTLKSDRALDLATFRNGSLQSLKHIQLT